MIIADSYNLVICVAGREANMFLGHPVKLRFRYIQNVSDDHCNGGPVSSGAIPSGT